MLTRRKKQIIYGLGFLIILGLIIWWLSVLVGPETPPAAPSPTPTTQVQPIQIEDISTIQHTAAPPAFGQIVDIVVRLRNPNLRAGVAKYPITLNVIGTRGQVLQTEEIADTYLLPSAVIYAVKLGVPVAEPVVSVEVKLPQNPVFSTVPASVSLPSLSPSIRDRTVKNIGNTAIEEVKGIVTNDSSLDWQFVEVTGVATSESGEVVGVGKTFVGKLRVGEQREFTLQWPATRSAGSRITAFASTNIYRQENIVRAIGDPSLLR